MFNIKQIEFGGTSSADTIHLIKFTSILNESVRIKSNIGFPVQLM